MEGASFSKSLLLACLILIFIIGGGAHILQGSTLYDIIRLLGFVLQSCIVEFSDHLLKSEGPIYPG